MFGIKWLWKSNKTNIDTSNFVSREFLSTTLQDYVNRDLLNTTLSNELANYVSTTTLNNTLNNYVLNSSLNTTLSSYVQTNTLNTTLSNYVQTSALNNYVSTNTNQSISGAKTFTEGVIINKTPVPLTLKATDNNKTYIVYKDSADNSNLSIGSNATSASIEVNRGNLEIETQQENKNISINTGRVKFNRSTVEFGTEINAGYGGGTVKFIPEDNTTKTLQFYNSGSSDTRRFNLLVPEPSAANSPTTKNYVDTKETAINSQISTIQNSISSKISVRQVGYKLAGNTDPTITTGREFTLDSNTWGLVLPRSISINDVLNITLSLPPESSRTAVRYFSLSYCSGIATRYVNQTIPEVVVIVKNNGYDGSGGAITPNQIDINITLIDRG